MHILSCCMKPYNIKGTTVAIYVILAQVKLNISTGQRLCGTWMLTDDLARPVPAIYFTSCLPMNWQQLGLGLGDYLALSMVQVSFEIEQSVLFWVWLGKLTACYSVFLGHTAWKEVLHYARNWLLLVYRLHLCYTVNGNHWYVAP